MLKKVMSMIVIAMFLLTPAVSVHAAVSSVPPPVIQVSNAEISPFFVGVNRITDIMVRHRVVHFFYCYVIIKLNGGLFPVCQIHSLCMPHSIGYSVVTII